MLNPYLFFDGQCEEAIEFYRQAVGADLVMLLRWKDSPDPNMSMPGKEEKIMHARFRIGDSIILASDGRCEGKPDFQGFALSLTAPDIAAAERMFAAISEGGHVQMPMTKTFFSPSFGMVADKFGVSWMVYVDL
ncbi:MAG TPA: VOC family protein [Stellaceae bacterium]|jgi:PhnB protein|nr:VOC family protein [Stellaceae bacterium]